jgi:cellulose synthase/poly-beta-1,6-N-acetylglucosamine synthase-like glycosyltransferase/peptidoglycan/xylan/chitin deacetylase (PgdA/CDA1 family)/spore germination protein YaaH
MVTPTRSNPVFLDPHGRRAREWRRFWIGVGGVAMALAILLIVGVVVPPLVPSLPVDHRILPPRAFNRDQRERLAIRRSLAHVFRPAPPARRGRFAPPGGGRLIARRGNATDPIVAGFFVNWADNSLTSLIEHVDDLDWVVCEWGFLAPSGDSVDFAINRRVFDVVRKPSVESAPAILLMVSNYDRRSRDSSATGKTFSVPTLRAFLHSPADEERAIQQLRNIVLQDSLAGVTIDFRDVPEDLRAQEVAFVGALHTALAPYKRIVTEAVPSYATRRELERIAAVNDYVFAMLFDEHYGTAEPGPAASQPGPVASQQFYIDRARNFAEAIPPQKLILMVGAYGYDWNDGGSSGEMQTFQETMQEARDHHAATHFDSQSLNPYLTWTDPDSTDHVLWYLDAVTAYNQIRVGRDMGVAGTAIWRLGEEDASIWSVLGRRGLDASPDSLRTVPAGYDVEFVNDVVCESRPNVRIVGPHRVCPRGEEPDSGGDILRVREWPTAGARALALDPQSGYIVRDSIVRDPKPYVVDRYGQKAHEVALTFDDGPDGTWTPDILDTLRAYHAPATFFLIGENIDTHIALTRRIYAEGHEIGSHTYSHPNLALTSDKRTRVELDATEDLIESVIDHRTAFFRPPYFGDATPTTPDELVPVGIATRKGYYTVGLRDDSEDWQPIPVDSVIALSLSARDTGNVILLHDGGGNRARTVAALGPIIDSLRARGDTLVLLSQLVGISRDEAMPPLPRMNEWQRFVRLAGWMALGSGELALYWIFMVAVVLGIGRLVLIGPLAILQRILCHQRRGEPTAYAPPVSVVVPAFNEARVIQKTVKGLLTQRYDGPLEVIVVDDGSTDNTYQIAQEAFADARTVSVFRKENGGKASALNFGLARARHEIVIALDADTIFAADTVAELVQPLADPRVGAVAGNAKVGNRVNLVTRWQALEYVTSQNLDRRAFSLLNGITVVPGAVGAWRKTLVDEVGGFRSDTLAEDQDLTMAIRRAGHSIAYADGAIGYTEAPDTFRALAKQRFRWSFGTLQCAWKYRSTMFNARYGSLGFAALPNTWLFQLLLPALSPLADLAFVYSLLSIALTRSEHGNTFAMASMAHVFTYYAVFLLVDWLAAAIAFLMEPGEDKSLTWLILIQRFAYRQLMYWVVVRSFKAAFVGRFVGWGKLERKATVQLPVAS